MIFAGLELLSPTPRLNGSPSRFLRFFLCAELSPPGSEVTKDSGRRLVTLQKGEFSLVLPLPQGASSSKAR